MSRDDFIIDPAKCNRMPNITQPEKFAKLFTKIPRRWIY
jgi:hypothetical protein